MKKKVYRSNKVRSNNYWILTIVILLILAIAGFFVFNELTGRVIDGSYTPISTCQTINQSGNYYLTTNISKSGDCLVINASNVVVDGNGYKITGNVNGNGAFAGARGYSYELNNIIVTGGITSNGISFSCAVDYNVGGSGGTITIVNSTTSTISAIGASSNAGGSGGNINIINSTASSISVDGAGGITAGGGNGGTISINNSYITSTLSSKGGTGYGGGGPICGFMLSYGGQGGSGGTITVSNSRILSSITVIGANGGFGGGGPGGTITIVNSTTTSLTSDGAWTEPGGDITVINSTLTTISSNGAAGGDYAGGHGGKVTIVNSNLTSINSNGGSGSSGGSGAIVILNNSKVSSFVNSNAGSGGGNGGVIYNWNSTYGTLSILPTSPNGLNGVLFINGFANINSCQTISYSGNYNLTSNISAVGTCLTLNANDVNINGNGYKITGNVNGNSFNLTNINIVGNVSSNGGALTIINSTISSITSNGGIINIWNSTYTNLSSGINGQIFINGIGYISSCQTISYPGNYILNSNISAVGTCLTINANDVNINGQGYKITGNVNGNLINLTNINIVGNVSSNGGNVTVINSNIISSIINNAGIITLLNSTAGDLYVNGNAGGNGGNITIINSTVISLNSNGGRDTYTGGNGGNITIINSNVTSSIIVNGGGFAISYGGTIGFGGVINIWNSTYTNLSSGINGQIFINGILSVVSLQTINLPGIYYLNSNAGADGTGAIITINSNNVSIIGNGDKINVSIISNVNSLNLTNINIVGNVSLNLEGNLTLTNSTTGNIIANGGLVNIINSTTSAINVRGANITLTNSKSISVKNTGLGATIAVNNSNITSSVIANQGTIVIINSTTGNVSSNSNAGQITFGGTIVIINSTTGNVSSNGLPVFGSGGHGGMINITNSNVSSVMSNGAEGNDGFIRPNIGGNGGTINIINSITSSINSNGGGIVGAGWASGGNGGRINIWLPSTYGNLNVTGGPGGVNGSIIINNPQSSAVNGVCGITQNNCINGTLNDLTDNSTNFLWQCIGSNGGSSASCSLAIPLIPVNGLCSSTTYQCLNGTSSGNNANATNYLWQCLGANSGTNASCSAIIPVIACSSNSNCGSPTVLNNLCNGNNVYQNISTPICNDPGTTQSSCSYSIATSLSQQCSASQICSNGQCIAASVNGLCSSTTYQCLNGTSSGNNANATNYLWSCNGSYGGTNVSCSSPLFSKLNISKIGTGSGIIVSLPSNINCGATCANNFINGSSIILTATENTGSNFSSWIGCDSSAGRICNMVLGSNRTITVNFTLLVQSVDSDHDGIIDSLDLCPNTPANLSRMVNIHGCPMPILNRLNISSDLNTVNLSNITSFRIESPGIGKIDYQNHSISLLDSNGGAQYDLDANINITNREVIINSSNLPSLNLSARITLYNISFVSPKILLDGNICTSCNIISYNNSILSFDVPHFTNYTIVEGYVAPDNNANPGSGSGSGSGGGSGGLTVSNATNNAADGTNLGVNDIANNADNSGISQSGDNSTGGNSDTGSSIVSLMVPIIYVLLVLIFVVILLWFIVNRIKRNRYNALEGALSEEKSSPVESSKSKKTEVRSNDYKSAKKIINEIDKNLKNKDSSAARENYNKLHDLFKLLSKSEKDELYEDSMRLYKEIEKLS